MRLSHPVGATTLPGPEHSALWNTLGKIPDGCAGAFISALPWVWCKVFHDQVTISIEGPRLPSTLTPSSLPHLLIRAPALHSLLWRSMCRGQPFHHSIL